MRCAARGRPSARTGSADRQSAAPMAPGGRSSGRRCQAPDSRRPQARRSPRYRDRARKVTPQWDHLLASGCCAIVMSARADRRTMVSVDVLARRAGAFAVCQMPRKSGLRRSHSQAKPRASNAVRA
jgi:hypothetical protein